MGIITPNSPLCQKGAVHPVVALLLTVMVAAFLLLRAL